MNAATYNEEKKGWEAFIHAREWYSVQDVAQILGVGGPTVYSAIRRGSIVAYKVGGTTKVKHDDLVDYVTRRLSTSTTAATADAAIAKIIPVVEERTKARDLSAALAAEMGTGMPTTPIKLDLFQDEPATESQVVSTEVDPAA